MKLFSFEAGQRRTYGADFNGLLLDLPAASQAMLRNPPAAQEASASLPATLLGLLRLGSHGFKTARDVLAFMTRRPPLPAGQQVLFPYESVRLLAPIPRPGKILCSGINYRAHKEENPDAVMPTEPFFFSKLPSAVIGPGEPIICPARSQQVDYEVEFAVVIGSKMKEVPEVAAMNHVAGYTILHDVSARDVQFKDSQITLGKNFDTFCPMGPCLVTADEIPDPSNLALRSILNGRVMQNGSTSDWVFPLPRLLSFLSGVMTLEPGDVVSTGTPAGVGVFKKPRVFLQPGDVIRLEVEGIGFLENPVQAQDLRPEFR